MGRSQSLPRGGDPRFGPDADDTGCPILHVDMDAFFASVEVRRRPELRGRPVVVGGIGPRGVVSSASYEARRYGVRSAMPTARARALCPDAVYLPPDFSQYSAASRAVMRIFRDVTPLVEPLSLDEAFLDVAGARKLFGPPARIARLIRRRVAEEQQLTCSVGVGPSKFVAKLGSTRAKPDGLLVVPAARVLEFLHPLPVDALWGVGERSAEALRRLGLHTVGALAEAPLGLLRRAVGEAAAAHLHELSWGRDPRRVSPEQVEKSIGAEVTFDADVTDPAEIRRALLALAEKVGARLRAAGQVGRTVSLKVRLADFRTVNRSRTLAVPTDTAREMFDTSWALWTVLAPGEPVRLVGVRMEGLAAAQETPRQLTLGEPERGWREAEAAADAAAARFGRSVIGPASLLGKRDPRRVEKPPRP
ncbi:MULTISPECIES: DNA polymerase IV [Micromonospora]|uniref:DNA polymerase IV n=1 Tax=Micromonospora solifontis TaxID=2487138 RepID=A0ABX9WFL6_9ACTN|nr:MULTISPECIES: DNA polymerase IV [Micromonospora]NES12275.1 DNA polymerase IV [Micromonospora sp. PPF5-17B]NES37873.1 DNA polymerase IV [Micromonospora solifontis]NES54242.1 DNA polymerase IV [Micromonospora sp. PPF5-6]RNL97877.1 DNA polymerase IV [Micromonospora solifontis]